MSRQKSEEKKEFDIDFDSKKKEFKKEEFL